MTEVYTPVYSLVTGFKAVPYQDGVLLSWTAGLGESTSTNTDLCWVSIQYAEYDLHKNLPVFGYPIVPNTPPYVVRDYIGYQGTANQIFHPNGVRGRAYFYSLFIFYGGTAWFGPFNTNNRILETNVRTAWTHGTVSYSKLGTNTRLSPQHRIPKAQVIVWNPYHNADRDESIRTAMNKIKPAHVDLDVLFERYFVAHTTQDQMSACMFDTTIFEAENGVITNISPTIDSSFSGAPTLSYGPDTPAQIGYDQEVADFPERT